MPNQTLNLPDQTRSASFQPATLNVEARTIEICWTTGATVRRARWEGWDEIREYEESLEVTTGAVRLERMNTGAPFLDSHRVWGGIGAVLGAVVPGSVRIENGSGFATVRLTDAEDVAPLVHRIMEGTVRSVSVGYRVYEYQITKRDGDLELWKAVDWEPLEVSAVAIPADFGAAARSDAAPATMHACVIRAGQTTAPGAVITQEGNMPNNGTSADDQQENRNDAGQPQTTTTGAAPAPAAPQGAGDDAATVAERAVAAERQRTAAINSLCNQYRSILGDDFGSDLIARGVSIDIARKEVLDKLAEGDPFQGRAHEPSPARPRDNGAGGAGWRSAVETALLHKENVRDVEMTEDARQFRGLTLMEIARHALERSGVDTRGMHPMEVAGAALAQRSTGYHTTGDFPAVLGNIGNRTLRAAYSDTPRTFTTWARRATLSDFRPTTRLQVSNAPVLEKVLEGAEFKYGTFGESSMQYALATYGKIIAFSRQMLINDDLGAFMRIVGTFGARAAQLEGDLVYAILLNNPVMQDGVALFHADHGNLGTGAVIGERSLTACFTAFSKKTDIDGKPIDVSPQFIIVPPGPREVEARKSLAQTVAGKTDDVNVYAGQLQVVSERRLQPSTGQAPWFVMASNSLIDTIEYAYLAGEEGLFTETRNGFEVDGVEVKARLDFAASAIDHRGLYKNPGAAPA